MVPLNPAYLPDGEQTWIKAMPPLPATRRREAYRRLSWAVACVGVVGVAFWLGAVAT